MSRCLQNRTSSDGRIDPARRRHARVACVVISLASAVLATVSGCARPAPTGSASEPPSIIRHSVQAQLSALERDLALARRALKRCQDNLDLTRVEHPDEALRERLVTLEQLSTELELDLLAKETVWTALRDAGPDQVPPTSEVAALVKNDASVVRLVQQVQQARARLSSLQAAQNLDETAIKSADQRLNATVSQLEQCRADRRRTYATAQIEQARQEYLKAKRTSGGLKDPLAEATAAQRDLDQRMTNYLRRRQERDQARLTIQSLDEKKADLQARLAAVNQP